MSPLTVRGMQKPSYTNEESADKSVCSLWREKSSNEVYVSLKESRSARIGLPGYR